jgi:hypothetical protein
MAMAARLKPGFSFWIVCDRGYAVGLMTHHVNRLGHLIWMAEPFFDEAPTIEDVEAICQWRWPVFFPLGTAMHRKLATKIGQVEIPPALQAMPRFRSSNGRGGWNEVVQEDQQLKSRVVGATTDKSLPIYSVVNDTRLKEMLVTDSRPADRW